METGLAFRVSVRSEGGRLRLKEVLECLHGSFVQGFRLVAFIERSRSACTIVLHGVRPRLVPASMGTFTFSTRPIACLPEAQNRSHRVYESVPGALC